MDQYNSTFWTTSSNWLDNVMQSSKINSSDKGQTIIKT